MEGLTFDFILGDLQLQLLKMTLTLLIFMMGSAIASAYIFRNYFSCSAMVIWAIAMFASAPLLYFGAEFTNNAFVAILLSSVFGAATGGMLGGYTLARLEETPDDDKTRRLVTVLGVLAGSTVFAGIVGLFSGGDFQSWEPFLIAGLFFVLGIIVLQIFFNFGKLFDTIIGSLVSLFWVVYMIVYFNKITVEMVGEPTWGKASYIASNIFLDIVNLFLWLWDIID